MYWIDEESYAPTDASKATWHHFSPKEFPLHIV